MAKLNPGSFLMVPATCLKACKTGLLKTGDIAVLAALAKFADNDTKVCWPSVQTLCDITGISKPTVSKALKRLTQAGLIKELRKSNHGKGEATKRQIVFSEASKLDASVKPQKSFLEVVSGEERAVTDKTQGLKYLEGIKKNIRM